MVRCEMLTKTVLGLALFICQSALSLKTGCNYPNQGSVEKDVLYYDLKCTYMFSGLTQMLVTKLLIDPPFFMHITVTIGKSMHYSRISKYAIDSLYRLNVSHVDALWALHLYLSMVNDFYKKSVNKESATQKIITTHNYVIAQLRNDLKNCRKDNSFNYEIMIISENNLSEGDLRHLLETNFSRIRDLLTKNNICGQPLKEYIGATYQTGSLLLNNISMKHDFKEDFMNVFNVQVDWYSTSERLRTSWVEAHILNWGTNKFENLKSYYKLTFNFLKIIMFRLTLKHLNYLESYVDTNMFYVFYAEEYYKMVKQFGGILSLSDDFHVKGLLVCLVNLVKREQTIQSVVSYLITILTTLCLPLGCKATKQFELNSKEYETSFKTLNIYNRDGLKIKKSPFKIEYYSLENTRAYLYYLNWVFKYTDFNLVQLLIEYINDVDP